MSTLADCKDRIRTLADILYNESILLSEGRVLELNDLVAKKTEAMVSLENGLSNLTNKNEIDELSPQIDSLQKLAVENGVILKSVMNGLKSARERLDLIRYSDAKVGAYNSAGESLFNSEDRIFSEKRV